MPNYQESVVTGSKYTRCSQIFINNPLDKIPSITFSEEQILSLEGEQIHKDLGGLYETLEDPTHTIELLDPQTGTSTGVIITYADLYKSLYSLYLKLAKIRDEVVV